jgi:hypothetical protein
VIEQFPGTWVGRGSPTVWSPHSPDLKAPISFSHGNATEVQYPDDRINRSSIAVTNIGGDVSRDRDPVDAVRSLGARAREESTFGEACRTICKFL